MIGSFRIHSSVTVTLGRGSITLGSLADELVAEISCHCQKEEIFSEDTMRNNNSVGLHRSNNNPEANFVTPVTQTDFRENISPRSALTNVWSFWALHYISSDTLLVFLHSLQKV